MLPFLLSLAAEITYGALIAFGYHKISHRLSGLNNRNLFLTVLEAGSPRAGVPAWSGSSEGFLTGLQTASFSMYVHIAFPLCLWLKREVCLSLSLSLSLSLTSPSYKATNPVGLGSKPYNLI